MKQYFGFTLAVVMSLAPVSGAVAAAQPQTPPLYSNQMPEPKKPHGCLGYGVAGAIGGHFVRSGHAILGGLIGCAYGLHEKHKWKKEHKAWEQANGHLRT